MNPIRFRRFVLAGLVALTGIGLTLRAGPADAPATKAEDKRVSVAEARERARLLHEVYQSTLDAVHHHYFRSDRPVLPARAMEDVFADVDKPTGIKAHWIAVNTQAMSVNHEPDTAFEKRAAAELAAGKTEYEQVEKGVYRRAEVIPLGAGCVSCHARVSGAPIKSPRFAGLVISIPVKDK
jgi:hypothetical protein